MKRVALFGVKHCGKSTLGRAIARNMQIPFFDLDDLIDIGKAPTLRQFYQEVGVDGFRRSEAEAYTHFLDEAPPDFILATGGGVAENPDLLNHLTGAALLKILIDDKPEKLYRRIARRGLPPFLSDADDPHNAFLSLYQRRVTLYRSFCDQIYNRNGEELNDSIVGLENLIKNS